jgi:hypothetical protein
MNPRNTFVQKLGYLIAMGLLLLPLYWLSHPTTAAVKGSSGSPGGKLARMREEYHLSQAQLGQIDPTSVTLKLATLGLRGVAANILWEKAMDFNMKKDWINFAATLNQITKIQPNFVMVWVHQGWNLSYNVSNCFDDYRERYRWVIKGIEFFKEGMVYNTRAPKLVWELAWTIQNKIGRADEYKQYRRLFKADDDFHGTRPVALRDNWLVAKERFTYAEQLADAVGGGIGKQPLIYRSNAPMCQMYYADVLEKEGAFGEVAKQAWVAAADEWYADPKICYGTKDILTSFRTINDEPIVIHLNDQEMHEAESKKLNEQIEAIQPGLREKIREEKRAALPANQREAVDIAKDKRTPQQAGDAAMAEDAIKVDCEELAKRITGPRRKEALDLAKKAKEHDDMIVYIRQSRNPVNFNYWRLRSQLEQTEEMLKARRFFYEGLQAFGTGDLLSARDKYNSGFEVVRKVLDEHKEAISSEPWGDDLIDFVKQYRRILKQLDEPFPTKFILQDVIDEHEYRRPEAWDPDSQTQAAPAKGA